MTQTGGTSPLTRLLREHLGLVLTGAAAVVTAVRLMVIAAFDPNTAFTLLREIGAANVLLGTLVSIMPFLLMGISYLSLSLLLRGGKIGNRTALWIIGICAGVLAGWAAPAFVFLVMGIGMVSGMAVAGHRGRRSTASTRLRSSWSDRVFPVVSALLLIQFLVFTPPWLPLEVIDDGEILRVGYVLSADSEQVTLLESQGRTVVLVDSPIKDRYHCQRKSEDGVLASPLWTHPILPKPYPGYPTCPEVESDGVGWQWLD